MSLLAVYIRGTFTELMAFDDDENFYQAKSLTTPHDFTQGIVDCIRKSGIDIASVDALIHGSTIAINTLIERKGADTALIVTRGTRDVYAIGRGNRRAFAAAPAVDDNRAALDHCRSRPPRRRQPGADQVAIEAFGAGRREIFRLILGRGMALAMMGVAIGAVAALGLTRVLKSLLFGVSATDPWVFAAVAALLVAVALFACYIPARRAARVDPLAALRHE